MSFISNVVNSVKGALGINTAPKMSIQQAVSSVKPKPQATYDSINQQANKVQQQLNSLKSQFWTPYAAVNAYNAKNAKTIASQPYRPAVGIGDTGSSPQSDQSSGMGQYIQPERKTNWGAYLPFINQIAQSANKKEATPMSVDLSPYLNAAEIIRKRRSDVGGGSIYG